nr:hypothetical protein CFP56_59186 [Quercus suber]
MEVKLGVSEQPGVSLKSPDLPKTDRPPPKLINLTVAGRLPPTEPNPFGLAGGFPPQKPEPPDLTIKSTKSGEIQRFSDKKLLEIHYNPLDPTIFWIFQRRAT